MDILSVMNEYTITLKRTVEMTTVVKIQAETQEDAIQQSWDVAENQDWNVGDFVGETEVSDIQVVESENQDDDASDPLLDQVRALLESASEQEEVATA